MLTHNPNKEISEYKRSNPDPKQDIGASKYRINYLNEVVINFIPLIESEKLEKSDYSIRERAAMDKINVT